MRACQLLIISIATCFAMAANGDDFILSYWCGPPETVTNLDKAYAEVAECGFNYAMLPCTGATLKGTKAILDACKKHKLKYIVSDSRLLAFGPENVAFKTNLDTVIAEYTKHPALGGYYLADEPAPGAFPQLGAVNQYLVAHDQKRLPFINLYPTYVPEWAIGGTYEQYVDNYLTTVKPRLLSFDHYGLMTDGLRGDYFLNLEIIRRQGLKHNVPFGFIFQLIPFSTCRNPTESELRWQVNTALAYGAKALMYFTYWTPTNDPTFVNSVAIIDPQTKRSPHYEEAKRINKEIKAWAPTLMKLTSTGVYHVGDLPSGTQRLPENGRVKIDGKGAFIVGTFQHQDGSEWLIVMNRNMRDAAEISLSFDASIKSVRDVSTKNGRLSRVKLKEHRTSPLTLAPGGAKLMKLAR